MEVVGLGGILMVVDVCMMYDSDGATPLELPSMPYSRVTFNLTAQGDCCGCY